MIVIGWVVIAACLLAIALWAWYFPYPSPLIRRWLPPQRRWPEDQIRHWLKRGGFDKGFLRFFYRDPERHLPATDGLVAPADGLVTSLDVQDGVRYLVIALSFWDMHIQRSPLDGRVKSVEALGSEYMDGEGRNFAFLREKACPVQKRIVIQVGTNCEVAVRLITSLAARRLEAWVGPQDAVQRGQRIGRILLGSTVVLEVPEAWPILVNQGQRVWASETVVAKAGADG